MPICKYKFIVRKGSQTYYTNDYGNAYWYALSVKGTVSLNPEYEGD